MSDFSDDLEKSLALRKAKREADYHNHISVDCIYMPHDCNNVQKGVVTDDWSKINCHSCLRQKPGSLQAEEAERKARINAAIEKHSQRKTCTLCGYRGMNKFHLKGGSHQVFEGMTYRCDGSRIIAVPFKRKGEKETEQ